MCCSGRGQTNEFRFYTGEERDEQNHSMTYMAPSPSQKGLFTN